MKRRVVIWDPAGEFREGSVVEGAHHDLVLARKAATLPVEPDAMTRNGCAGWVKRAWGDGVDFHRDVSRQGCPVAIHIVPRFQVLNWIACVEPTQDLEHVRGRLRLAADTKQVGTMSAGIGSTEKPIIFDDREPPGKHGVWLVGGRQKILAQHEGLVGLCLFGTLSCARVRWLAVSQTR